MAVARLYLPESNTSRQVVLAIANSLKVMDRHGNVRSVSQRDEKWSRACSKRLLYLVTVGNNQIYKFICVAT